MSVSSSAAANFSSVPTTARSTTTAWPRSRWRYTITPSSCSTRSGPKRRPPRTTSSPCSRPTASPRDRITLAHANSPPASTGGLLVLVQVVPQDLGPRRVPELRHRLGLDLPDPLAGDAVDLADLVQRLRLAVGQAEAHRDHAGLALGERVEHRVQLLLEQRERDRVCRDDRLGVLDQVAELAVAVLAERG